ncbi:hypothetical protein ASD46_19790 [Rhizobium sp. Root491]|nr:hypothetical protein ASD46_19790 [Rhizobium sp. Root491]OMP71725.1 hypothetical protein BV900_12215 [Agrobacterium tumefaciens]
MGLQIGEDQIVSEFLRKFCLPRKPLTVCRLKQALSDLTGRAFEAICGFPDIAIIRTSKS